MKVLDIDGLNYYDGKIKQTYAPLASPALTGNPTATTQTKTDNSTKLATTAFVKNNLNDYATLNGATFTGAVNGVTPTAGDDSTKLATTAYVQEELRQHASMPIGHEYFTMNPNVPQGSLPLFGGEYSRSTYADLWAWVQTQTGYCKTEAEWQTLSASNNGNVPFYSSGDGSTTFRVPSLKCWVKGANGTVTEVGSYLEAGLPNVKGNFWHIGGRDNTTHGMISYTADVSNLAQPATGTSIGSGHVYLDASSNSSIYGNSSTVQPESIVGMWLVKAYGTIEDTGTIDEQQYIDDRIAAEVTRSDGKYLPLAGGTMTGSVKFQTGEIGYRSETHESPPRTCKQLVLSATDIEHWNSEGGAKMALHTYDSTGTNTAENGSFGLLATDGTNSADLVGYPNGDLIWAGNKHLECSPDLSVFKTAQQFTKPTIISNRIKDIGGGYKRVGNIVYVYMRFRLNTTLAKGGWGIAEGFPAPYNMGFSDDYRIPLIATAWYGDPYSGNVSSAFMDSGGLMRLITNGQMESTNTSNYYIHVYGNYYAE